MSIKRWFYKRFLVSKAKLKRWFELEDIRRKIQLATGQGKNVSELICSYLSVAICDLNWLKLPWTDIIEDYALALNIHRPEKNHKIFLSKEQSKALTDDGSWYSWANLFANKFGWSLEYIAELDIDDAISLIQEILYSDQLEKEWEWGLSEKSVSYDKASGKGKFVPLKRPDWMVPTEIQKPAKSVKILKSMLPVGVVYGKPEDFKH